MQTNGDVLAWRGNLFWDRMSLVTHTVSKRTLRTGQIRLETRSLLARRVGDDVETHAVMVRLSREVGNL
jgi:hypothetical protein